MEAYPSHYTEHNLPLVLLSGLGERQDGLDSGPVIPRQESGTKFASTSPTCNGDRAQSLLQHFLRHDGRRAAWNAQSLSGPSGALKYSMRTIGRTYTLPPRKAAPLPQSPSTEGVPTLPAKTELHSPLSPLSPGSPIFSDGLFTPLWLSKHQQQVPCLFLAFFDISAGESSQDEQIKADINIIRTSLSRAGFKTRFAAVVLSDRSILQAPDLEERLSSIRRLTSLDLKTGLFFMPPMSSNAEIATFVQSIMTTLQPMCVEHYRELTKHARRKKARGGPPPSASVHMGAGSQSLSSSGWNTRYEVKQGAFAEFRQEMDVAERHYTAAIDELFSSEGIFEATASWSPRWEEARLLCDALAIRTVRCQLWHSQTTGAVQSWINYKDRTKDLVDRRSKGSDTYGWAAWEARWAEVMARLVTRSDLSVQRAPDGRVDEDGNNAMMQFHMAPEKSFTAADRLHPLQMLHHSGYWLRLAADATRERGKRAHSIPPEDRAPPGQSPASTVANISRTYDLYLVPGPHHESAYDHLCEVTRLTDLATEQFEVKGQGRMMEVLNWELAKDLTEAKKFEEAMDILLPLWKSSSWRQEDWHDLFGELTFLLYECAAKHLKDAATTVATAYELQSSTCPSEDMCPDLPGCLDTFQPPPKYPVRLEFHDNDRLSPIVMSFAFDHKESHVGETLECQLTISCRAKRGARFTLTEVKLQLDSSRAVVIRESHDEQSADNGEAESLVVLQNVAEKGISLEGEASLAFRGTQKRTFCFQLGLRQAGQLRLTNASFVVRTNKFEIQHSFGEESILKADCMLSGTGHDLQRRHLPWADSTAVSVLPKPPKLRILLHGQHKQYYTDERLSLTVEILNEEADIVEGKLAADVRGDGGSHTTLSWSAGGNEASLSELVQVDLPALDAGASRKLDLVVQAPSDPHTTCLSIEVDYKLSSDDTPLQKTLALDMSFVVPFEAQYNFGPILYTGAWPSIFDPNNGRGEDSPGGIPQLWRLSSQVHSLAAESLVLHEMELITEHIADNSACEVRESKQAERHTLMAGQTAEETFELRTQKLSLEDRRPTTLESSLLVTWSRDADTKPVTTSLSVPRLTLPIAEPRVLCTLWDDQPPEVDAILHYNIENPSTHFLTFALTMEASEDFAFGGPKYRTLSLAPLSRHSVEYSVNLYDAAPAAKEGGRWIWPSLQVVDSYYHKNLKVHAAGPNVKMEEKGSVGVWIEL